MIVGAGSVACSGLRLAVLLSVVLSFSVNPARATSATGYDDAGRLTGLSYKNSGGTTIAAYTYTLDAAGNRTSATSAGTGTEKYALDPVGRLTGVTYADGTAVSFSYDPAGNRKSMTSGGSTTCPASTVLDTFGSNRCDSRGFAR